jgi:hypothetical protein
MHFSNVPKFRPPPPLSQITTAIKQDILSILLRCTKLAIQHKHVFSWFQTFAVFWTSYVLFWVVLRGMEFNCQIFGILCLFHLQRRVGTQRMEFNCQLFGILCSIFRGEWVPNVWSLIANFSEYSVCSIFRGEWVPNVWSLIANVSEYSVPSSEASGYPTYGV